MTIISHGRDLKKDLERVRRLSSKIEGRIRGPEDSRMERLSQEQLQDLDEILRLAHHLLAKHEDKKDLYGMLKEFVDIIDHSAGSIENLDGEIEELVLSAEESISRIRDAQSSVAKKVDFDRPGSP